MFKVLSRVAKVLEIKENKIKLELFSNELPSACKSKGCSACKSQSPQIIRDYPKSDFLSEVAINDIVKVESRQVEDATAAAVLFLTPILFSAIFYHISSIRGISSENILSVVFAFLGGLFGFALVIIFDKIFRKLNPTRIFKE
jgi:positive regulator of sigma E activity